MADETLSMSELQFNFFLETMLQKGDKCPHCHGKPEVEECIWCSVRDCPHNEPLHYHHDGCPACIKDDHKEGQVGEAKVGKHCYVCGYENIEPYQYKVGFPKNKLTHLQFRHHEFVPCVKQTDYLLKAAEAARLERENEKLKAERDKRFFAGVVCALDIVAGFDNGVMFREIVEACGKAEVEKELMANGLPATKKYFKKELVGK